MDKKATEVLRADIRRLLLHTRIPAPERKAARRELTEKYSVKPRALDRHIDAVRKGELQRPARADKGTSRKLTEEHEEMLTQIVTNIVRPDGSQVQKDRQVYGVFCGLYPDARVSYDTVHRALDRKRQELKALRVSTPQRIVWAAPNDRWECDISWSDFFLFDKRLGDTPKRAQLWGIIDCCTRTIAWAGYAVRGDSATFGGMMLNAMLPKTDHLHWPTHGTPVELAVDHGKVFKGRHGSTMLAEVGIAMPELNSYRPQDKGRIERWFGTCHRSFENLLPGYCPGDNKGENAVDPTKLFRFDGVRWFDRRRILPGDKPRPLLDLDQANEALHHWIMHEYHVNVHRELGCAPRDQWAALVADVPERLQHEKREVLEATVLLLRETRTVRRGQFQVANLFFSAPDLASYEGMKLEVRYAPDDATKVAVYYDGRRVCEARNVAPIIAKPGQDSFRKNSQLVRAEKQRKADLASIGERVNPAEAAAMLPTLQRIAESEAVLTHLGETVHRDFRGLTDEEIQAEIMGLCNMTVFGLSCQLQSAYRRSDIPERLLAWYDANFRADGAYLAGLQKEDDFWAVHGTAEETAEDGVYPLSSARRSPAFDPDDIALDLDRAVAAAGGDV